MNKQKIISFIIVALVVLVPTVLLVYGNMTKISPAVSVVPVINEKLPPMTNKDGLIGNKDDLVAFTVSPGAEVHGILSYRGTIKGGYFFEANILINILDLNKKVLKASNGVAKGDWMTSLPVDFEGNIDFSGLPAGPAYFEIHNDNASGLPEHDKSILIPITIK